jgi:hypothetical protein
LIGRWSRRGTPTDISSIFILGIVGGAILPTIGNGVVPCIKGASLWLASAALSILFATPSPSTSASAREMVAAPGGYCNGGKYDPTPSPRRAELPPRYNTARINRNDGPEDGRLSERCLASGLPEFGTPAGGSFRRIVQTPGGVSMFYDVGQGQGWQRNIAMNGNPHLPANIRQWFGDSRGHWEGNTLVIDVTNFGPKTDFRGSRENLHLVEHWTRTGPTSLEYVVTIEDPTVWTRPWTVKQRIRHAERTGEQNLLRAPLHRRKLCPPGAVAWSTYGRTRLCGGTRS